MKRAQTRRRATTSAASAFQEVFDKTRRRFVATFGAQCDSLRILVDQMAALGPQGSTAALTHVTHRMIGLAGTIGFPTISARASELEALVGDGSRGAFDSLLARDAVDAIRKAFAKDLASPPTWLTTPTVSEAQGAPIAKEASGQPAIVTAARERPGTLPLVRVLIVDDHAIVRRGLRALLADEFRGAAFGEASEARQALDQLRKKEWDIALIDVTLPGKSGLDLLKEVRAEWPRLPILILSGHPEDQFAVRVLKAGAGGYMTKDSAPEELAKAVRKILGGGRYVSAALAERLALGVRKDFTRAPHETLSDREYDVMSRIALGKTVTEIAKELSLSAKTISTYRVRILEKLGVRNSAEIVQYAIRNSLVN